MLVRNHPIVQAQRKSSPSDDADDSSTETDALLTPPPGSAPPPSATLAALGLSTKISSTGVAIGYLAGAGLQVLAILILRRTSSLILGLELILLMVGTWWAVFTVPVALWMRPRPGPPLPRPGAKHGEEEHGDREVPEERIGWEAVGYAWRKLWVTIRLAKQLKDVMLFLAAWFCMSDG